MKKHIATLTILWSLSSCVKDSFDSPAPIGDPNLTANYSISKLKSEYKSSGKFTMSITQDYILSGIVTADDKSNNFYKEIVLQDSGAAIGIKIDRTNLYNDFPVGRRVFIKLKGLAVGSYNNLIQLGGFIDTITVVGSSSLGAIPSGKINDYLIKGSLVNPIQPEEVSISNLNDNYQYKLIKIKKVEFDCPEINSSYADALTQNDASRTLKDCNGKSIWLRTSGFSNFAGTKLSKGNGDITAIYNVYKTDKQLKLRDLNDVKMGDSTTRCVQCTPSGGSGGTGTGGGGGSGTGAVLSTIAEIRALYAGAGVKVQNKYIEGTVISDKDNKNIDSRNMCIQDATGGIVIRFSVAHAFALGDRVKVSFGGDSLIKYAGLMEFTKISSTAATKIGTETPLFNTLTISEIKANMNRYESTLVKCLNVTISGGAAYYSGTGSGSTRTVTDAGAKMDLYTLSSANFANTPIPTGQRSITGIVGIFNTSPQLTIRSATDVQ